jgi:hypothetical protein
VRNFVAKGKQGKADISTLQESGHFYLALTGHEEMQQPELGRPQINHCAIGADAMRDRR